jgi:hypothetical protein
LGGNLQKRLFIRRKTHSWTVLGSSLGTEVQKSSGSNETGSATPVLAKQFVPKKIAFCEISYACILKTAIFIENIDFVGEIKKPILV